MSFWLIVATSGRMLAKAARREGYDVLVIDCYADVDTLRYAEKVIRVDSFSIENLTATLDALKNYSITGVVYGSGFETCVESLSFLQSRFSLAGNSPTVFERVTNKKEFFAALKTLEIPYPETHFSFPYKQKNWLSKPLKGQGGVGINSQKTDIYWQHYCEGQAGSVLFLAHEKNVTVIGFHRQWTQAVGKNEFLFSGICHDKMLSKTHRTLIENWLQKLVKYFDLSGFNSLDFIQTEKSCFVLEINARPSASIQLYDFPIFSAQIKKNYSVQKKNVIEFTSFQIIYASRSLIIPKNFNWSKNCQDLPHPGMIIHKNQPICSMITHRKSQADVVLTMQDMNNPQLERSLIMKQASVNKLSQPLVQQLIDNSAKLRVGIDVLENGCRVIDAGINHVGGLEAGRIIAEICLGGMGTVTISHSPYTTNWPLSVNVHTGNPVLGCLGSQYAGWSLSHEKYSALGSGPARAMATKTKDGQSVPVEDLYQELAYHDNADTATLVIENDAIPPLAIIEKVAAACDVAPSKLTIIVTPTSSLAGGVQVVARVLEVAMHKAHALHFPLENIIDGSGSAPICPPHPNFVKAMGRTNDAILFAGQVHLFVKGSDEAAEKLAKELPSSTSKDYGKPFAEIFKACDYDFFKIDAMLFSPASVIVTAVDSGKTFRAGQLDNALLDLSFS